MESAEHAPEILNISQRIGRRLLSLGHNRLELFAVEVEEERNRLMAAALFLMSLVAFGMLACMAGSAVLVIIFWKFSPWAVLLALTVIYAGLALFFLIKLRALLKNWQAFSATINQLHKDRECLEQTLS